MPRAAKTRWETRHTPGAPTYAPAIRAAARRLGWPFMPWQNRAARLIGELNPDRVCRCHNPGRLLPRWTTIIISVPRQSGKTALSKAATTAKAESLEGAQLYGTAQSRIYAVKHLESLALALGSSVYRRLGTGAERIGWPNGSKYEVIAPNETGGHGDSIDWMLVDEGWKLEPHVLGGIRPAMAARHHSQMLITSTMGTIDSDVWNQLVVMGREATMDPASRIAYLEYSAPDEGAVFEERRWIEWMPALGFTLTKDHIRDDMALMKPHEFVRAYGNLTVQSLSIVFPEEWYGRQWVSAMEPPDRFVIGLDVNEEPGGATITSAHELGADRGIGLRTLEWRLGSPRWIPGVLEQIITHRHVEALVGDFGGPARAIFAELVSLSERYGVPLIDRKPRELGGDTGSFHDELRAGTVWLERNEYLETALRGATRKPIGDLWVPHRRSMRVDASPLISAILAYGIAREFALTPRLPAIW